MGQLKINPEFKDLIPPLTPDEYSLLEQNIIAEGCRDSIKAWKGVIVDGHNRYKICSTHGLSYDVESIRFSSKDEARCWIVDNQLGRRNLSDAAYIELALHKARHEHSGGKTGSTRKTAAKITGFSEGKIHQYMKIRKLGDAEILKAVKRGDIKIGTAYKGLELTTKTVSELCPGWEPNIDGLHVAAVAVESMNRISAFYGFIYEYYGLVCDGGVYGLMQRLFRGQLGVVDGCLDVMLEDDEMLH